MFGHDEQDDGTQQQGQGMMPAEPMNDGTLGAPMTDTGMGQQPSDSTQAGAATASMPPYEPTPTPSSQSSRAADAAAPEDLISIKQEALQNLKPLVGHLDQTPEEAFRMTMMMIQATDDQSLIPHAYEAAKALTDEKVRAQALLDVVNEINYFTSQSTQN